MEIDTTIAWVNQVLRDAAVTIDEQNGLDSFNFGLIYFSYAFAGFLMFLCVGLLRP